MGTEQSVRSETRSERRKRQTHEQLLEATRQLLLEGGRRAVTSRNVADRSDLAVGTFYNHFETVDDAIDGAIAPTREWLLTHAERILAAERHDVAVAAWVTDFLLRLEERGADFEIARNANVALLGSAESDLIEQMKQRWGDEFTERGIAPGAAGPVMIELMMMCGDLYGSRPLTEATAEHLARMIHAADTVDPQRLEDQVVLTLESWRAIRQHETIG